MTLPHRCLFLSDLHLGSGRTRARALWELLQRERSERVVLVGDILDLTSWQQSQPRFSQAEWLVVQWLLQRQRAGELVWLLGNHEQPLRDWLGASAPCSWISEWPIEDCVLSRRSRCHVAISSPKMPRMRSASRATPPANRIASPCCARLWCAVR